MDDNVDRRARPLGSHKPQPEHSIHGEGDLVSTWTFCVPRHEISYVRFIVEAYDGLAQISSDKGRDELRWIVPCSQIDRAERLAKALAEECGLTAWKRTC